MLIPIFEEKTYGVYQSPISKKYLISDEDIDYLMEAKMTLKLPKSHWNGTENEDSKYYCGTDADFYYEFKRIN